MDLEIRETEPGELRQAVDVLSRSLLVATPDDDWWERGRASWEAMVSYSAWDGAHCVGHGGQYDVSTTVPGGARLATGAVTRVGVLPTHTRRGAATGLMRALVQDAVERGWPLQSLRASEALIYRRHGFGVAGHAHGVRINRSRARPVPGAAEGTFRLVEADEIPELMADLYPRCLDRRPGLITRPNAWSERHFRPVGEHKENAVVVIHLDTAGRPDGYVYYTASWSETGGGGDGEVRDLFATSDAAELALWQYLFDVDLVETWNVPYRPVDDVVLEAVADRRAYQVTGLHDEQWLRVVDVDAALTARAWAPTEGSVVIEIRDPLVGFNNNRWLLSAGGPGPVERDRPSDLVASIDALSAQYLGGMSWRAEAAAGRIRPGDGVADDRFRTALDTADRLFSVKPLPFCGTFF